MAVATPREPILVASHDAGGAEVVSSWLRQRGLARRCHCVVDGPAVGIFGRKHPDLTYASCAEALERMTGYGFVLTGTSGQADLERVVIRAARAAGVRCAAFLDHWTAYVARFTLGESVVLPDEIWAGDEQAVRLAREAFPAATVRHVPNPYMSEIVRRVEELTVPRTNRAGARVLYLTQPTSVFAKARTGDLHGYGYDEFEALEQTLALLGRGGHGAIERLRLRLHPAEEPGKYDRVTKDHRHSLPVEESGQRSLEEDCAWADWVAGCETMAMVVALHAGRRVLCTIPPGGRQLTLPFPDIVRLFG